MRKEPLLKLARSPLILGLAQVRFAPVLKMETYVADIQDVLRKEGFPGFQAQQVQQIVMGPKAEVNSEPRWVFSSPDRREAVILTKDFVVYETSRYDRFETFTGRLEFVLELVKKKVDIALAERLALRFVDLIQPTAEKRSVEFLQPALQGLSAESIGATTILGHYLAQAKTPCGELFIRCIGTEDGTYLPPDLASTELHFDVHLEKGDRVTILDFDHISVAGDFDVKAIISKMWDLHGITTRAFRAAVTADALSYWQAAGGQQ